MLIYAIEVAVSLLQGMYCLNKLLIYQIEKAIGLRKRNTIYFKIYISRGRVGVMDFYILVHREFNQIIVRPT